MWSPPNLQLHFPKMQSVPDPQICGTGTPSLWACEIPSRKPLLFSRAISNDGTIPHPSHTQLTRFVATRMIEGKHTWLNSPPTNPTVNAVRRRGPTAMSTLTKFIHLSPIKGITHSE